MAKDNLFLGMARGKVGDVVFSRLNGVQVSRARNRAPHNPQSPAQMVQRIIMSTVGKAYSFMQAICNHSFEGFDIGQQSQRKFMEVNVGMMRDRAADVLAYPVEEVVRSSEAYNFNFKNDYTPVINEYMISAGSLPSITLSAIDGGTSGTIAFDPGELDGSTLTYDDFIGLLGLQRGDQLTFVQASHDGSLQGRDTCLMTGFRYARVILEPSDGDMTSLLLQGNQINKPNPRNEGAFSGLGIVKTETNSGLSFNLKDIEIYNSPTRPDRQLVASAVILSRQSGSRWLRSTQFLKLRINNSTALQSSTLGLAYETYRIGASSDLYLNQAE